MCSSKKSLEHLQRKQCISCWKILLFSLKSYNFSANHLPSYLSRLRWVCFFVTTDDISVLEIIVFVFCLDAYLSCALSQQRRAINSTTKVISVLYRHLPCVIDWNQRKYYKNCLHVFCCNHAYPPSSKISGILHLEYVLLFSFVGLILPKKNSQSFQVLTILNRVDP